MNWRQYNWLAGCAAVCLTVAVLFSGQMVWQKFAVAKPLDKAFLEISGVTEAVWDKQSKNGEPIKIYVTLQNIENLARTYAELNDGARKVLGKKPFKIVIHDGRSAELEQFNYKVQYLVQEAIFTGNFSTMTKQIAAQAKDEHIDLQMYVDAENVYLQTKKAAAEMYVVIPRQFSKSGGESQ